jgi:protease PrsW
MTLDPVLLAAAIAPALIFLAVVSVRLEHKKRLLVPRPLWTIALAVLMGVGSAFLALGIGQVLNAKPWGISSLGTLALFTLIGVGLVEEGAKFLLMRSVLWRLDSFKERYDGILYGAAVGLGFGATENIIYVLNGGMDTAVVRAFTAVPMHGLLGVVSGYYLGKTKISAGWGFTALWWAVVAHGFYDFLAFQSSPLTTFSLFGFIVWLAWWSFKASREARRYSPSWGGRDEELVSYTPPPIQAKSPLRAALLSLIPGFGQFYNQEPEKGKAFLRVGIFNGLLVGILGILLSYPLPTLALLELAGISLGKDSLKFVQGLQNSPLLTLLGITSALFLLYGMWDAYATAKSQKFDYLLPPDKRNRIVQNLGGSYLGHLSIVLLLVLVPILGGASGGRPETKQTGNGQMPPMVFDLVETPQTLEGHGNSAEGTKDGKDKLNTKEQKEILASRDTKEGESIKPRKPKQAKHKQGIPRSYSDYLSYRLRIDPASYDFYFSQLGQDQWTVVRYRIETDGSIASVDILEEHTTAPREVAQIAVDDVYRMGPVVPPPTRGKAIVVTELFWRQAKIGQEGSLENRLSGLPDGRMIELES